MVQRRTLGVAALAALTAGCIGPSPPPRDVSAVCHVQPCQCVAVNPSLFAPRQTADVDWPQVGPPQCPAGFRLEVTQSKP